MHSVEVIDHNCVLCVCVVACVFVCVCVYVCVCVSGGPLDGWNDYTAVASVL